MSQKPETVLRQRVMKQLKRLPHSKFFSIQQSSICGDPDIMGVIAGRFVAIEFKSAGETPRRLQLAKLGQIRDAGGVTLVIDPFNFEQIWEILVELSQGDVI